MLTSHAQLITFAVDLDVLDVSLLEFLHGLLDILHASVLSPANLSEHGMRQDLGESTYISFEDTLVWRPAPFQSPGTGLGWKETLAPNSSAIL